MLWLKGRLLLPDRVVEEGVIQVAGARIAGLWDLAVDPVPQSLPPGLKPVAGWISPGFIDLHVHGGGGADFIDGRPEAAALVARTHAQFGTTGLLATTLTATEAEIIRAIAAAAAAPQDGARILGFHVEGPFLNPNRKGAQDGCCIRPPALSEAQRWLAAAPGDFRWMVTLAPELDGAPELIRHLAAAGVVVSAGHTDCSFVELQAGVAAGLTHATHLFNAMSGMHHREPGAAGGALALPELTVDLIADSIHLHPATMAMIVRAKGPDGVILITDAIRAAGMPEGTYRIGPLAARVSGGRASLEDGTLAGSLLTMAGAVRNMVELAGLPLHQAVCMASLHPARRIGLAGRKGSLAAGKDADLLVLSPDLQVEMTMVEGEVVFDRR